MPEIGHGNCVDFGAFFDHHLAVHFREIPTQWVFVFPSTFDSSKWFLTGRSPQFKHPGSALRSMTD